MGEHPEEQGGDAVGSRSIELMNESRRERGPLGGAELQDAIARGETGVRSRLEIVGRLCAAGRARAAVVLRRMGTATYLRRSQPFDTSLGICLSLVVRPVSWSLFYP